VVDAAWINQHRTEKSVALLDGRSQGEYTGTDKSEKLPRSGHIPGAINLPWELTYTSGPPTLDGTPSPLRPPAELRKLLTDAGITPDRQLVAYCTVGMRAAHWYFVARYLGLRPKFYDGSMRDWSPRAELPVVEGN
jgi:thiosulfate/3-mercaptopyruvate sulfurtransferase